jgi:hypothetical protein
MTNEERLEALKEKRDFVKHFLEDARAEWREINQREVMQSLQVNQLQTLYDGILEDICNEERAISGEDQI